MRLALNSAMAVLLSLTVLPSCSDDASSTDPGSEDSRQISGWVVKGPVEAATVFVESFSTSVTVAGPFSTDAAGFWSGDLPEGVEGPLRLIVTDGHYVDEVTAETISMGSREMMGVLDRGVASHSVVTPWTHAMAQSIGAWVERGVPLVDAVDGARGGGIDGFGFDLLTTRPAADGSQAQRAYAAQLGGICLLIDTHIDLVPLQFLPGYSVVWGMAQDLADGKLDGIGPDGGVIPLAAGDVIALFPLLDDSGSAPLAPLATAANSYARSTPGLLSVFFDVRMKAGFEPIPPFAELELSGSEVGEHFAEAPWRFTSTESTLDDGTFHFQGSGVEILATIAPDSDDELSVVTLNIDGMTSSFNKRLPSLAEAHAVRSKGWLYLDLTLEPTDQAYDSITLRGALVDQTP